MTTYYPPKGPQMDNSTLNTICLIVTAVVLVIALFFGFDLNID